MQKAHKLQLVTSSESHYQFEQLLIEHLNSLYSTALRLTGAREKADDLVQESSMKAFKNFDQLKDRNKVKSWLMQILVNTFRDSYRKKKGKPGIVDIELTEELVSSVAIKAYDQEKVFGGLLTDEVQDALSRLPFEFRMVVVLADLEDHTYKEIAEILQWAGGRFGPEYAHNLFGHQLLEYLHPR